MFGNPKGTVRITSFSSNFEGSNNERSKFSIQEDIAKKVARVSIYYYVNLIKNVKVIVFKSFYIGYDQFKSTFQFH